MPSTAPPMAQGRKSRTPRRRRSAPPSPSRWPQPERRNWSRPDIEEGDDETERSSQIGLRRDQRRDFLNNVHQGGIPTGTLCSGCVSSIISNETKPRSKKPFPRLPRKLPEANALYPIAPATRRSAHGWTQIEDTDGIHHREARRRHRSCIRRADRVPRTAPNRNSFARAMRCDCSSEIRMSIASRLAWSAASLSSAMAASRSLRLPRPISRHRCGPRSRSIWCRPIR